MGGAKRVSFCLVVITSWCSDSIGGLLALSSCWGSHQGPEIGLSSPGGVLEQRQFFEFLVHCLHPPAHRPVARVHYYREKSDDEQRTRDEDWARRGGQGEFMALCMALWRALGQHVRVYRVQISPYRIPELRSSALLFSRGRWRLVPCGIPVSEDMNMCRFQSVKRECLALAVKIHTAWA